MNIWNKIHIGALPKMYLNDLLYVLEFCILKISLVDNYILFEMFYFFTNYFIFYRINLCKYVVDTLFVKLNEKRV